MGARPQFASVALSGTIAEGSPTITFASLESHKIGGLVRVPREIEEQSIVPMGQFLARYGAVEFARAEDTWASWPMAPPLTSKSKALYKSARITTPSLHPPWLLLELAKPRPLTRR